jgi:carbonic anhydrase/acetyltransferase-like protein (isoleucine patch superfamily)
MPIFSIDGFSPRIVDPASLYLAPGAQVIGNVSLGREVSIWFNAVLRADNDVIAVGDRSNIQDGAIIHADPDQPTMIGEGVTIGHRAIVHGATIGDGCLVGMGATVLNGARIGANCLIGANALVTEGREFPEGSLIVGMPAKLARPLTQEEIAGLRRSADSYVANGRRFAEGLQPLAADGGRDVADSRAPV